MLDVFRPPAEEDMPDLISIMPNVHYITSIRASRASDRCKKRAEIRAFFLGPRWHVALSQSRRVHIDIHIYIYVCVCVCLIHVFVHTCICIYTHINIIYIYIYVFVYLFIYQGKQRASMLTEEEYASLSKIVLLEPDPHPQESISKQKEIQDPDLAIQALT